MKLASRLLMFWIATLSTALAQTVNPAEGEEPFRSPEEQAAGALEAERARLARQRIQTESEIRAREEQRRLEQARAEKLLEQEGETETESATAADARIGLGEARSKDDMSRTLRQLRTLGELRDDGYITEEEFLRIKKKIIDSRT